MADTKTVSDLAAEEVAAGEGEVAVTQVPPQDIDPAETQEWLASLEYVLNTKGPERVKQLLALLDGKARQAGIDIPHALNTPYINTIPVSQQPRYPGNREIERRIKSIIRWNAMAMVHRANKHFDGLGGHISTFASSATLYEVGYNHFFRGRGEDGYSGDLVYFQGHASPGMYSRAFLEGRLSEDNLEHFRRELQPTRGLSSYPHPWLMPDFWEFPTVSMGLGPIMAIYQARFNEYLKDRGIRDTSGRKVWAFLGDGECDEPETLGAITLAGREHLDNLIFVVNCNLQRLDGPVRGNGKIIQELEGLFVGAGWNVIKVIWGDEWDPLLEKDETGLLIKRMEEVVDGQYQKYTVMPGAYIREHFFGKYPELLALVENYSDEKLVKLRRGGHDPEKVYAAYKEAVDTKGRPTVILAKTIKGYGLGEAGEGRNIAHNNKKLNEEELFEFRTRFGIPISDEEVAHAPFYKPPESSAEMKYLHERREALGGYIPSRPTTHPKTQVPRLDDYKEFLASTKNEASTTFAFVRLLRKLCRDKQIGKYVVPIVPDESRTFGMEGMFNEIGIYSHVGQLYEPVDSEMLAKYKESVNGQILEEGITEAGSMSSFNAAGTAYSSHGINMIPFFIYYSMFGFQRIGDLIWAAQDMRAKGFLIGGTAGRTTLNGEGLQHQDGHSLLNAIAFPNVRAYDPAYAYEIAVIVLDGMRKLYEENETAIYYLMAGNEGYIHPEMPAGVEEGIVRGMYKLNAVEVPKGKTKINLFGSGAILRHVLAAQEMLAQRYQIASNVWSVTSYTELRRDCHRAERWNMLHPAEKPRKSYVEQTLAGEDGLFIAASDYVRALPEQITRWVPGELYALGTDGMGRSETRETLRRHFEVDAESITLATLYRLHKRGVYDAAFVAKAIGELGVNPEKIDPYFA
jgi:pyruvate dehydrogenase E1 component